MSTRRLTNIQFSQNHAIDGTRVQSAIDDIYERFNNLQLEDLQKKHTLQTLVLKCSGPSRQMLASFPSGALTGSDRPLAPFIDHAMINVDATSDPAVYRAKGVPEPDVAQSFVWTSSTKFIRPVTIESVTVHIDADDYTAFSTQLWTITYTGAHGLAVGDKIQTLSNNGWVVDVHGSPIGTTGEAFRVVKVINSVSVQVIWYASVGGNYGSSPGLGFVGAAPLTTSNKDGSAVLTAASVGGPEDSQVMRIIIDCPYLQYSTDRRLNAKAFDRNNFPESMYAYQNLNNDSAATVDMFPSGFPLSGWVAGNTALYYHNEDLNIALPAAQSVNFRLAFGHPSLKFCFPSSVPSVTYTITYREQIID